MRIKAIGGKGGVGKTTCAVAIALQEAENSPIIIIDYDAGHTVQETLSLRQKIPLNKIVPTTIKNLELMIVDPLEFKSIEDSQKQKEPIQEYLGQFKEDDGLLPFCDMIVSFFGGPIDTSLVSKFTSLIKTYHQLEKRNTQNIILDVEPTGGLTNLLNSAEAISGGLERLQNRGIIALTAIGTRWPDIKAYLKGDFIKNADKYVQRIINTANALKDATYFIACNPEKTPVTQMKQIKSLINSYGGKVDKYIINNIKGEPHEGRQIKRVEQIAKSLPIFKINRDIVLSEGLAYSKRKALKDLGAYLLSK